jgi:signal transduction histidine kinase
MSNLGILFASLAHEMGTPLNIILGRAEYLLDKLDDEKPDRSDLEVIIKQANKITNLIRKFLDYARDIPSRKTPCDMNGLIDETLTLLHSELRSRHINLKKNLTEGLPPVYIDSAAMQQALMNILMNSIQAMEEKGEVSIKTCTSNSPHLGLDRKPSEGGENFLKIEVIDTAGGIPDEIIDEIFKPFFTTKKDGEGTGLGLTIVKEIIKDHCGHISVESKVGEGTKFTIFLPF